MSGTPSLSVLIVTYNAEPFLRDCLKSVALQKPSFAFEVIVTDNASSDKSVELIRSDFPGVQLIASPVNAGFAAATNRAFAKAAGEYILLLNPDTILNNDALERLVGFLRRRPDAGAIGPRIFNQDGSPQRTGVSAPSLWNLLIDTLFLNVVFPRSRIFGRHRRLYDDPERPQEVDCLQGSCLLIRGEALNGRPVFDESYFLYFEETDLCTRLRQAGWKVMYVPDASIIHLGGSGVSYYDAPRILMFHRSFLVYLQKHSGSLRRLVFRVLLIVRALSRSVFFAGAGLVVTGRRAELFNRSQGYLRALPLLAGIK